MTSKKAPIILGSYSMPEFEYLKDNPWTFTEKVEGTNVRVIWNGGKATFGGKTDNAQMPIFLLHRLQSLFESDIAKQRFISQFGEEPTEVCLYGEGYGARIQKGGGNSWEVRYRDCASSWRRNAPGRGGTRENWLSFPLG